MCSRETTKWKMVYNIVHTLGHCPGVLTADHVLYFLELTSPANLSSDKQMVISVIIIIIIKHQ